MNLFKRLLRWAFSNELAIIESRLKLLNETELRLKNMLGNIDVSVDVHQHARSWAVISIQGKKADYIKFIDLGESDLQEIRKFVSMYDRSKVDASPQNSPYLRIHSETSGRWV